MAAWRPSGHLGSVINDTHLSSALADRYRIERPLAPLVRPMSIIGRTSTPWGVMLWEIRRAKEMRRAIDCALTRPDVDSARIAYVGASWGGRLGGLVVATEPRFKTATFYVAGIGAKPVRPEIDLVAESLKGLDHYLGPVSR